METIESTVGQEVGATHQLAVVSGSCSQLSVSRHDANPADTRHSFNIKLKNFIFREVSNPISKQSNTKNKTEQVLLNPVCVCVRVAQKVIRDKGEKHNGRKRILGKHMSPSWKGGPCPFKSHFD